MLRAPFQQVQDWITPSRRQKKKKKSEKGEVGAMKLGKIIKANSCVCICFFEV